MDQKKLKHCSDLHEKLNKKMKCLSFAKKYSTQKLSNLYWENELKAQVGSSVGIHEHVVYDEGPKLAKLIVKQLEKDIKDIEVEIESL